MGETWFAVGPVDELAGAVANLIIDDEAENPKWIAKWQARDKELPPPAVRLPARARGHHTIVSARSPAPRWWCTAPRTRRSRWTRPKRLAAGLSRRRRVVKVGGAHAANLTNPEPVNEAILGVPRRPAGLTDRRRMDSRTFLGLQQSHNPYRWWLPVEPHLCTGGGFLFGGCGLGAAISAMEGTSGREVVWATGPVPGVRQAGRGDGHRRAPRRRGAPDHPGPRGVPRRPTGDPHGQRRPRATGRSSIGASGCTMPDVPPPDECADRPHRMPMEGTVHEQHRAARWPRAATSTSSTARRRRPDADVGPGAERDRERDASIDATTLAILGDFVPMGVGQALGRARRRATAWTTPSGSAGWCRRSGCCSTSRCTRSSEASATAWCTCSPRTARCSPRPARAALCECGPATAPTRA